MRTPGIYEFLKEPIGSGWLLESIIGEGGMGVVYRARRGAEAAAVKLLHAHLVGHSGTEKRVLREAVLLGKLNHPGICRLKEADVLSDGRPFLVMDLLQGQTLKQCAATGKLPVAQLIEYTLQVLEALTYAHERGVIHRDLKPSNLFLTAQGRVKILDFGVARSLLDDSTWQSSVGELIGTPSFMAPEQASGKHEEVGPATDIWSLGATLFTLLTGEYVHPAESELERVGRAMTVAARKVRSVVPDFPEALAAIIDKALAFEMDDRFRSAVSMRCAIKLAVAENTFISNAGAANTLQDEPDETLVYGSTPTGRSASSRDEPRLESRHPLTPHSSVIVRDTAPIQVIDLSPRQLLGAFGPRVLTITWRAGFSVSEVEYLRLQIRERAKNAASPVSTLIDLDIELGDRPPSAPVREAIIRVWREEAHNIGSTAIVHESRGFVGALVRTVTTGILWRIRAPSPTKACASLGEGCEMVLQHAEGSPARAEFLEGELRQMRGELRAHARGTSVEEGSVDTLG